MTIAVCLEHRAHQHRARSARHCRVRYTYYVQVHWAHHCRVRWARHCRVRWEHRCRVRWEHHCHTVHSFTLVMIVVPEKYAMSPSPRFTCNSTISSLWIACVARLAYSFRYICVFELRWVPETLSSLFLWGKSCDISPRVRVATAASGTENRQECIVIEFKFVFNFIMYFQYSLFVCLYLIVHQFSMNITKTCLINLEHLLTRWNTLMGL